MEGFNIWLQIVFPIAMFLASLVSAIIGSLLYFAMMRHFDQQDRKEEKQDQKIDTITKDLAEYKEAAPQLFPLREDYLLKVSRFDNKLDKVNERVNEIQGMLRMGGEKG